MSLAHRVGTHVEKCGSTDIEVELPEFDGKMQGDTFRDWLYTIEKNFEFKEFSEERKVKLVAIRLKGYSSLWWKNLKKERIREERRPIQTWGKMKRALKKRFLSENYRQDNYTKFYNFMQYNLSMEEYIRARFSDPVRGIDLGRGEGQRVRGSTGSNQDSTGGIDPDYIYNKKYFFLYIKLNFH